MGFHPHMYASVRGFDLVDPLCNLVFDQMTVDLWRVVAQEGARGRYVSMHPRIVLLLHIAASFKNSWFHKQLRRKFYKI